jgi:hypothetical protein
MENTMSNHSPKHWAVLSLMLTSVLTTTLPAADPATDWVGARGPNGTGIYPDSKPPTSFDVTTGMNVRWIASVNGWGNGQPVVGGDRVFIVNEGDPVHLFPRLQCLDVVTGKLLWESVLDHFPAAEPDEKKRAEIYKGCEIQEGAMWKYHEIWQECKKNKPKDNDFAAAVFKREIEKGFPWTFRNYRYDTPLITKDKNTEIRGGLLMKYGIWTECYLESLGLSCIGKVFGAPIWVENEKAVYVVTASGYFGKFDINGKCLWTTWSFKPGRTALTRSGVDTCARAPTIYRNFLISTVANSLTILERDTGKIKVSIALSIKDPSSGKEICSGSIASPVVMTVGATDILLTVGPNAYRLPECTPLKVEGWLIEGMQALVKHDERDVVFFCGAGEHCAWPGKGTCDTPPPAAIRYTLEGDTLRGKVIWSGVQGTPDGKTMGGNAPWLLYDQGKLYHRSNAILNALSGKVEVGTFELKQGGIRTVPATGHLLQIAGGHVYGFDNKVIQVCTVDGKFVTSNVIPGILLTKEQIPIWSITGIKLPEEDGNYYERDSYGKQFTFGKDCLIVRQHMNVFCFSEGAQLPTPPSIAPEIKPKKK